MRREGFTLIEIMVVLVIIGIVLAVAIPNLFVSDDERVRQQTERLSAVFEQTRDDAAMRGRVIAVRLSDRGVEFALRDPDAIKATWKPIAESMLEWRDGVRAVVLSGDQSGGDTKSEDIVFVPAGVSKPFEVLVYSERNESIRRIIVGDALGNVSLKQ